MRRQRAEAVQVHKASAAAWLCYEARSPTLVEADLTFVYVPELKRADLVLVGAEECHEDTVFRATAVIAMVISPCNAIITSRQFRGFNGVRPPGLVAVRAGLWNGMSFCHEALSCCWNKNMKRSNTIRD